MKLVDILSEEDYRGHHQAPDKFNGAPLHNLTNVYPDDIYSSNGARYYGDAGGDGRDYESISIISSARNKPSKPIKAYRAIPKVINTEDKINDLQKQKAYILKYGKVPAHVNTALDSSKYYDLISDELTKLLNAQVPTTKEQRVTINPGDWVSINRRYAAEHGKSTLNNHYKIISKTVPAKHLYTDGNSIHEWGYDPS